MRLLIVQKNIRSTDYSVYLRNVPQDIDLICFGELAATGCLYRRRKVVGFGTVLKSLAGYDFAVMLGLPRRTREGFFNSYLYCRKGRYQIYDKIHLFPPMNEDQVYQAGAAPGLFDTEFGRLGVAICYDLRFENLFRKIKAAGADMIFVPAAFPRVRISDWRALLVKRAGEIGLPVIGINAVGDDGVNEFGGSSMVVDGHGRVILQATETEETVLAVEL